MPDKNRKYPKISIITVVFNGVKTIEETILSVVNQTYENIEYIIIDGGSVDGTVDIIKKYEDRLAYWVSESDNGIYDAMNKGIKMANGDWLYFIQAGDILRNNILKNVVKYLKKETNYFVYGNVYMKDKKKIHNGKYNKYELMFYNICQQSIFYRKKIFDFEISHELKYRYFSDWDLNLKCFGINNVNPIYIDIIIADYEGNGCSVNNVDECFLNDKTLIIKRNFGLHFYYIYIMRCWLVKKIKKILN